MAKEYLIKLRNGLTTLRSGNVIEVGKGKKAVWAIGVLSYKTRGGDNLYELTHIPTGSLIVDRLYYRTLAYDIAREIVANSTMLPSFLSSNREQVERDLLSIPGLFDYISYWPLRDIKHAPKLEEWLNGPEYEAILNRRHNEAISIREEAQHREELHSSFVSLGWVPTNDESGVDGERLAAFIGG